MEVFEMKKLHRYSDANTYTDNLTLAEARKFQKLQNGGTITPMENVRPRRASRIPGRKKLRGSR